MFTRFSNVLCNFNCFLSEAVMIVIAIVHILFKRKIA